jgi:hypothetical protein
MKKWNSLLAKVPDMLVPRLFTPIIATLIRSFDPLPLQQYLNYFDDVIINTGNIQPINHSTKQWQGKDPESTR